jgi:hypothetical protein
MHMPLIADNAAHDNLLKFEPAVFRENFPHRGFKIQHRLCDRPEFGMTELVELAQELPPTAVEYYAGNVSVDQRSSQYPRNGLSVVETVRRIEECGSWMVMKNVETVPRYGKLLRGLLDEWYGQIDSSRLKELRGGLNRERAFLFISSPNSVTPFHMDDEHNLLLQIRGSKRINLWDPQDRAVVSERQIESQLQFWHDQDHERYLPYKEEFEQRANVFEMESGEGVHFPFGAPHWVKNGPQVSVSFSVTFRSAWSDHMGMLYFVNKKLRRLGWEPTPPGQSAWRDSLKLSAFQGARRVGRTFRAKTKA